MVIRQNVLQGQLSNPNMLFPGQDVNILLAFGVFYHTAYLHMLMSRLTKFIERFKTTVPQIFMSPFLF